VNDPASAPTHFLTIGVVHPEEDARAFPLIRHYRPSSSLTSLVLPQLLQAV